MNRFKLLFWVGLLCSAVIFLANEGGRATVANQGNTGAPGDDSNSCVNCHNNNAALAGTISISLLDASNNAVASYMPGQNYKIRVQLDGSGTPAGHGFQLIPLKDLDNSDIKGMSDVGTNNYKIKTITNGRTYAEHDGISPSNIFDVAWKAPASGTGSITFYAAGNRVNGNSGSTGDGADKTSFQVAESSSSAFSPKLLTGKLSIFPNPVQSLANVNFEAVEAGKYTVSVRDLTGKLVAQRILNIQKGLNVFEIPASDWTSGVYLLELNLDGKSTVQKLVKM